MSGLRERQEGAIKQLAEFPERDPHPIIEANLTGDVTYVNAATREKFPDVQARGRAHFLLADWDGLLQSLRRDPSRPLSRMIKNGGKAYDERIHIVSDRDRVRIHVGDATQRLIDEESARRFELIADSARDFMTLINSNYVYEAANASYCLAHKLRLEALIGKSVSQVWGEQVFRTIIKGHLEKCFLGLESSYQLWIEFPNLGRRYLTVTYYPHKDDAGKVTHAAVVSRDITDEINLEEKLRRSAKQDVLKRMASGLLQELDAPVRSVIADMKMLDAKISSNLAAGQSASSPLDLKSTLSSIENAAEKMKSMIEGLKSYCPDMNAPREDVQVNSVIEKVLVRCGTDVRSCGRVVTDFATLPPVHATEDALSRVFEQLILNAAHSFEKKGAETNKISIESWHEDSAIKVAVSDNGREIPTHECELIFDPFFSASRHGKSSGLGLSVCQNIIASLGGAIEVKSNENQGALFLVTLPAGGSKSAQPAGKATADLIGPPRTKAYIVVIDDDLDVGSTIRNILGQDNEVVYFTNGRDAIKHFRRKPAVDIIFCDLMMPEMSGMEVYTALETDEPEMARRVVFLSGGLTSPQAEKFLKSSSNRRCGKPLGAAAVKQVVKDILG